ncbi:hypothetical protein ABIE18_001327, partial [Arthrobacter sp. 2762]
MGSIGDILARRAALSGAGARPRRLPLGSHTMSAHGQGGWESPTAAVTDSENPRGIWLLRGLKPLPVSEPGEVDCEVKLLRGLKPPPLAPVDEVDREVELLRGVKPLPVSEPDEVAPEVGPLSSGLGGYPGRSVSQGIEGALAESAQALESLRSVTVAGALSFGFAEASRFAGRVEEISRTVEYLQVIAAQAVERTRTQAQQARPSSAAGTGWQTGWTDPATTDPATTDPAVPAAAGGPNPATATAAGSDAAGGSASAARSAAASGDPVAAADAAAVADDGYRDAAQFLRARLRIGIVEARRRLALASEVLPRTGIAGQHIPAR